MIVVEEKDKTLLIKLSSSFSPELKEKIDLDMKSWLARTMIIYLLDFKEVKLFPEEALYEN